MECGLYLEKYTFLSRVSILTRDIDIANLAVSLSSVWPLRSGIRWKRLNISSQSFHRTVAQSFWFYQHQTFSQNSNEVTPCGGAKYRWGIKIARFCTDKSLYLANDTKYRNRYYGRRILVCDLSNGAISNDLERNLTLFSRSRQSDAKYLTDSYRYGHSYYRRWIENRTQAFEWHQFQWPWVTSKPDFKATVLFNVK